MDVSLQARVVELETGPEVGDWRLEPGEEGERRGREFPVESV